MITERLKNITHIPKEYLTDRPPAPRSVKIELSSKCNYRCEFCSILDRKEQPENMPWHVFEKITSELRLLGVEEIGLFLIGEPFTDFDTLLKGIKYLKQTLGFPYVFLTSNASLATPHKVEECMKAGLDSLKWSCNVANKDQFQNVVGVSPKLFEKAKNNIKSAYEIRNKGDYSTKLYASSIMYDDEQKEIMEEFLNEDIIPYVDEHYWLPLYSMGGSATEREQDMGYTPIAGNSGRLGDSVDPIPCWTLFTAGHVLSDGRLTACCADGTGNWTMGDLKTNEFMKIWHCDEFVKLRQEHLRGNVIGTKCEYCALGYEKINN